MSYCIINYRDRDVSPLVEAGTISPITPDIEGLLLEEIPAGYRIIGGTTRNTDVGILACKIEKIPDIMPGTETLVPPVVEPITVMYEPKNIKITEDSSTIFKNIVKIIEKKIIPLFDGKELLLYNSRTGSPTSAIPSDNQVLISFNTVPPGVEAGIVTYSFPTDYRILNRSGFGVDQLYPHSILDANVRYPIIQGDKKYIYVHWDALGVISDAKVLIESYLIPFISLLKEDISSLEFSVKKIASTYISTINKRIDQIKHTILVRNEDLRGLKKKIADVSNLVIEEEYKLNGMTNYLNSLEDEIRTKLSTALTFKEISRIEPVGTLINLYTNDLFYVRSKDEVYFIGKFVITVNVKEYRVSFKNQAITVDAYNHGMQAPHVFSAGNACLGNLEAQLPEAIKNGSLDMVALLCVNFLTSVNTSDPAGAMYHYWPTVIDGKLKFDPKRVKVLDQKYANGKEISIS